MTSAAAKVIIDAEDLASKKIADAARNVEQSVKNIKDVGGKAKASTEFIGSLANTLGGSQLSGYAGQLASLTEKVSQFAEVSKAGGAGALAFKVGLAGLVATLSFQVGKAIGNIVFQTEKWTKELEKATEQANKLTVAMESATSTRFSDNTRRLDLIEDPEEKQKATEELIKQIDQDIAAKNNQIAAYRKEVASVDETWSGFFSKVSGDVRAINEQNKQQIDDAERLKEIFKTQALELRRKIELDKEAVQLAEKKKAELEAIKNQKDIEKQLLDGEKAFSDFKDKQYQKRVAESERVAGLKQSELDRLKEERILLTEGAEAAKRFALEKQGIDKESAARIAKEQATLEEAKKQANLPSSVSIGSQAVQSRLLTRGPAEKGIDKIAKNTLDTVETLERVARELEKYGPPAQQLEVVG